MTPKVFGFTFARGGSKGVPRKNLREIGGKSLIAHAIDQSTRAKTIDRHFVSTDDDEIAQIAKQCGAEVPFMRPAHLASDTASELLAWKHAIKWVTEHDTPFDVFVSVPATSPLRRPEHVDRCVAKLLDTDADLVLSVTPTNHNPFFNMVQLTDEGEAAIMNASNVTRRQDAPMAYNITTVAYAARPNFVLSANSLWDGRVYAVEVPAEDALDIDTQLDFDIAEFLLKRRSGEHHADG